MKNQTVTKIHTQKDKTIWEWEETPETIDALKQLNKTVKKVNDRKETD